MRPLFSGIFAAQFALSGCAAGGDASRPAVGLQFTVSPRYPTAGDSVTLTLSNGEAAAVGLNLCTARLIRGASGPGDSVPEERMCTMELRILEPGAADSVRLVLPDTLSGPSYHYLLTVERQGAGETVEISTAEFRPRG
jgi:hypothetical protein